MLVSALIVEDHDVTRQGLEQLVENQLKARLVGSTGDGLEAIPLLREHEPDLLILDLGLPSLNGLDILRKVQGLDIDTTVVVLSMHGDDSYVTEAFQLGAAAYVLKGSPLDELTEAIEHVMRGEKYVSSDLSENLITAEHTADKVRDRYQSLTDREREVLQLTAEGYTSREVGERLNISHRTVEKHRENIQEKLELRNSVEMAAYVHRRGLMQDS